MNTKTDFKEVRVTTEFTRHPAQVTDQAELMKAINTNHAHLYQLYIENMQNEASWSTEARRQKHKEIKKLIEAMEDQLRLAHNYY